MKKACIILMAGLFINTGLFAQALTVNSVTDIVHQSNMNQIDVDNEKIDFRDIQGTPFWNDDFVRGQIILTKDGKDNIISAFIRYRIFDDMFEVKKNKTDPDTKIAVMKRSEQIAVNLKGKKFVLLKHLPIAIRGAKNGYSMILTGSNDDSGATLYKRLSQEFIPAKKSKTSYNTGSKARLNEKDYYFVKIDGRIYQIKPHKKKAVEAFPEHKKELKSYIKKNRLKFKNKSQDEDMIKLVNYYNSL